MKRRYLSLAAGALLVVTSRLLWLGPAPVADWAPLAAAMGKAPQVEFLNPLLPVPEAPLPQAGIRARLPLIPAEGVLVPRIYLDPYLWLQGGPERLRKAEAPLLTELGINADLIFSLKEPKEGAREAVRAVAAYIDAHPDALPQWYFLTTYIVHYFPTQTPGDMRLLLRTLWPMDAVYLLERTAGKWTALPLREGITGMLAEVRDLNGDFVPEIAVHGVYGGSGSYYEVSLFSNPGMPGGVRMLWMNRPAHRGDARLVWTGDRTELRIEEDIEIEVPVQGPHAMPYIRDRYTFAWEAEGMRLTRHERFATRTYWLNRLLDAARAGEWQRAAEAVEPETLKAKGKVADWFPRDLLRPDATFTWREEAGAATRVSVKHAGDWLVEYGVSGRVRALRPVPPGVRN